PLAINPNSDQYLEERLQLLDEQLATVTRLAKDNELPDAILTESGVIFRRRLHQLIGRNGCCAASS
ncbi:hypothetical protein K5E40_34165, partial [Pseudomonas baetica]|uniref:hypothetical protein n=1 Tax=Pseudomonas baetica TaxID=674054 RepID=UPI001C8C0EC4